MKLIFQGFLHQHISSLNSLSNYNKGWQIIWLFLVFIMNNALKNPYTGISTRANNSLRQIFLEVELLGQRQNSTLNLTDTDRNIYTN